MPFNSTLGGLYAALETLEASDIQDLDFAKTLLILEEVRFHREIILYCIPVLSKSSGEGILVGNDIITQLMTNLLVFYLRICLTDLQILGSDLVN